MLLAGAANAATPAPRWVIDGQLTAQARALVDALHRVGNYGLEPLDYSSELAIIKSSDPRADGAKVEAALDVGVTRLVRELHQGRVDPRAAGYSLTRQRQALDADAAMRRLSTARDPLALLATFEPQAPQYRALLRELARYRRMRTDLSSLPPTPTLRPGMSYAGAAKLRWLLADLGDTPPPADSDYDDGIYDDDLAAAVASFQRRHGLKDDGWLGRRTFAALTVPLPRRARQIELTIERWRWLPDLRAPAVIVNVPQYMLYALTDPAKTPDGVAALRIPVIVGQAARQTPIFDSAIESVVFRPYWDVPASIVREELLPLIAADPHYLARHEMEIVRGEGDAAQVLEAGAGATAELRAGRARLRQRPGPQNALGLIKFVSPNPYSVYLHSTPERALFARERRTLSHGCIRVSDASALAAYLLADTAGDWSADAIEAATCARETRKVPLARPVPVFILYGTVVVDLDGSVLFFDDVYGYDRRLESLLTRA